MSKMDSYREIENLIYESAWLTDSKGPRAVCEEIFKHCKVLNPETDERVLGPELADSAEAMIRTWGPEKQLNTAHRISNVWIEVDEEAGTARARSYLTMMQAVPQAGFPLQPIGSGVYHDTFSRIDGKWWFETHELDLRLVGDMSRHTTIFDALPLWQRAIYRLAIWFPALQRLMPRQS